MLTLRLGVLLVGILFKTGFGQMLPSANDDSFWDLLELFKIQVKIQKIGELMQKDCPALFQHPQVSSVVQPAIGKRQFSFGLSPKQLKVRITLAKHTLDTLTQTHDMCTVTSLLATTEAPGPCDSHTCHNNATCTSDGKSAVCSCLPGFTGTTCDVAVCQLDPTSLRIGHASMRFEYGPAKQHSAWMKDSHPTDQSSADKVWFFKSYQYNNIMNEFNTIEDMKQNKQGTNITLPYNWAGTGHVVYRGSVYYQRFGYPNIIKFDISNRTLATEVSVLDMDINSKCTYDWGGYVHSDFAVDEQGLWLVYGNKSDNCNLVIAKINPDTLSVEKSWRTTIRSKIVGNTFMKCGVLYAVDSFHNGNSPHYIEFIYDTNTGKQETLSSDRMPLHVGPPNDYMTMLDYNPHDGLLYYVDYNRGYLATYPISY